MSFRIIGDEIEYEYRPFAKIVAPTSVWRDCAEGEIELFEPSLREKEIQEAWDQGHEGFDDLEAERDALKEQVKKLDDDLEAERDALKEQVKKLDDELDLIEEMGGVAERIADLKADAAAWREATLAARKQVAELDAELKKTCQRGPKGSKTVRLSAKEVWALRAFLGSDTFMGDIAKRVCEPEAVA